MPSKPEAATGGGWLAALAVYGRPRVRTMLFLGFSAGLPFLLVFSTLSAWLTEAGVSRTLIGFFSWVGLTYSVKVLWAPVIDRLPLPWLSRRLGRRRAWMLLAQAGICAGLAAMALLDPQQDLLLLALIAVGVAFAAATQDVVVDAFRIEAAEPRLQGAMAASYVLGYRLALLAAGAGALFIADLADWRLAYLSMAALGLIGVLTTLTVSEPQAPPPAAEIEMRVQAHLAGKAHLPRWWRRLSGWFIGAVVCPFVDFFKRNGREALLILALIGLYRLSDITMGVMANPFYLDMGYSKSEIAQVSKFFGFFMSILGAGLGGILVLRWGVMRPLLAGAVLVAATNLLFAGLSQMQPDLLWLAVVIGADNLSGGLAGAAFIAYLSGLTSSAYTATQYALFSSLMTLPAKLLGGLSGVVVDAQGYLAFFVYAAALGLPAIALVLLLGVRGQRAKLEPAQAVRD